MDKDFHFTVMHVVFGSASCILQLFTLYHIEMNILYSQYILILFEQNYNFVKNNTNSEDTLVNQSFNKIYGFNQI